MRWIFDEALCLVREDVEEQVSRETTVNLPRVILLFCVNVRQNSQLLLKVYCRAEALLEETTKSGRLLGSELSAHVPREAIEEAHLGDLGHLLDRRR